MIYGQVFGPMEMAREILSKFREMEPVAEAQPVEQPQAEVPAEPSAEVSESAEKSRARKGGFWGKLRNLIVPGESSQDHATGPLPVVAEQAPAKTKPPQPTEAEIKAKEQAATLQPLFDKLEMMIVGRDWTDRVAPEDAALFREFFKATSRKLDQFPSLYDQREPNHRLMWKLARLHPEALAHIPANATSLQWGRSNTIDLLMRPDWWQDPVGIEGGVCLMQFWDLLPIGLSGRDGSHIVTIRPNDLERHNYRDTMLYGQWT